MKLFVVEYTINNYMLGAKLKITPTHKIAKQERIDPRHTVVQYIDLTTREYEFVQKVFARKGKVLEEYDSKDYNV